MREAFLRDGLAGPLPLLDAAECRRIVEYLGRRDHPHPEWAKSRALLEPLFYEIATHPRLLAAVTSILGPDMVLWGASAVKRVPGSRQPWHTDIESSDPTGGFVTLWIGVLNTARESSLRLLSHSHLLGYTVQEARAVRNILRENVTAEQLLQIVRESQPEAELIEPELRDGEALLFDGRIWHESLNARTSGTRAALLLQYAAAGVPVRIPDLTSLEWPFRFVEEPRPPVIVVAGEERSDVNRVVPPPPGRSMHPTVVHEFLGSSGFLGSSDFACALRGAPRDPRNPRNSDFQSFIAFTGTMSCHASVLAPGKSPHPPHIHDEEELLIPLRGEVELVLPSGEQAILPVPSPSDRQDCLSSTRAERVAPGAFAYYPSGQYHTIRNPGTEPAAYLMFKWNAARKPTEAALETTIRRFGDAATTKNLLEGPTHALGKLHAHVSVVPPGGGYDPHADPYDVAIVTLSGTIETLGQTVPPMSVVWYAAGDPHGLRNPGAQDARYLVFEFHSPGAALVPRRRPMWRRGIRFMRRGINFLRRAINSMP